MSKQRSSNAQILLPLMDQMAITLSASPRTLFWPPSSLRAYYWVHHGFDPGGARQPARVDDVSSSRQPNSWPLPHPQTSMAGDGNGRPRVTTMAFRSPSKAATESRREEIECEMMCRGPRGDTIARQRPRCCMQSSAR